MDPASVMAALGLAANIGQIVEYALIIVSKSREIHNSLDGVLSENRHTAVVTGNLYTASCTLSSYLDNCKTVDKASSPEDERLKEMARSCAEIAKSFMDELDKLRLTSDKRVKWKSFRQALKAVWGKGKLDILANTLQMYRNELKTISQISIVRRGFVATFFQPRSSPRLIYLYQEAVRCNPNTVDRSRPDFPEDLKRNPNKPQTIREQLQCASPARSQPHWFVHWRKRSSVDQILVLW